MSSRAITLLALIPLCWVLALGGECSDGTTPGAPVILVNASLAVTPSAPVPESTFTITGRVTGDNFTNKVIGLLVVYAEPFPARDSSMSAVDTAHAQVRKFSSFEANRPAVEVEHELDLSLSAGKYLARLYAREEPNSGPQGVENISEREFVVSDCGPSPMSDGTVFPRLWEGTSGVTFVPDGEVTLPQATADADYSVNLNDYINGGVQPLRFERREPSLPLGFLSFDEPLNGMISGRPRPADAGARVYTIKVTDSCIPPRTFYVRLNVTVISCGPEPRFQLPFSVSGTVGVPMSVSIGVDDGVAPMTIALEPDEELPAGLSLGNNQISGTPTVVGNSSALLRVTDACTPPRSDIRLFHFEILEPGACPTLAFTTLDLPGATVGTAYNQTIVTSGGEGTVILDVSAGTLPAGLELSGNAVAGTPISAGSFNFTVRATDSCTPPQIVTEDFTLVVTNPGSCNTLVFNTVGLGGGTVGVAYNQTIDTSGGEGAVTLDVSAGSLPLGLTLTGNVVSGTPTTAGTFDFTIRATDSCAPPQEVTEDFTIEVIATGSCAPLVVGTDLPPDGVSDQPYSFNFSATGEGTLSYQQATALPPGLTLDVLSGLLSGTPTISGPYDFDVLFYDSCLPAPQQETRSYHIFIEPGS